ncbi:MAG TPA: Trm112 family protein, partial [bacterium]|nr:Trm112 family protein [bacterium]
MLDQRLLDILACPICKTAVEYDEQNQKIVCSKCGRKYPVKDNIPIMLESE